jgi:hypothetical protein
VAGSPPRSARRALPGLAAALFLAACGGGGAPKSDSDAVARALKDAAAAVADGDGDKACSYLTADAQRQAALQLGAGVLGSVDCPTLIKRGTAFLTPLERKQIDKLEPANIQVNGTRASATMATAAGVPGGQGTSIQLNLQKIGADWKVSGFANAQGLPGGG